MIVDANDSTSTFHPKARAWLERSLNGPTRVGLPWVSLIAFQRISTHPRALAHPLSPKEAWSYVTDWLDADQTWIPTPGEWHANIVGRLIASTDARGNLITDAHLAALALEHGVAVSSFDSDFARFPELTWINPAHTDTT